MDQINSGKYYNDDAISIYEVLLILKKRWYLILVLASIFTGGFGCYAVLAPKVYKITNILIISPPLGLHLKFFNTLEVESAMKFITNLPKRQQAKELGLEQSIFEDIIGISISRIDKSKALKIEVDTLDGESGIKAIEAISIFSNSLPIIQKRILAYKQLLNKNKNDLALIINNSAVLLNTPGDTVYSEIVSFLYNFKENLNTITSILDELETGKILLLAGKTTVPEMPFKPRKMFLVGIGAFIGVFSGIFFSFFMEWMTIARIRHETKS